MATLYKKRGKFHIDYSINGVRKTKNTELPATSQFKREALRIKRKVEDMILNQDKRVVKIKGMSLEEANDKYLNQNLSGKSKDHIRLAKLTYRRFTSTINSSKNVREISTLDLQNFVDEFRKDESKSIETIRTYLRYLKMFFNFLVEEDIIIKSPFKKKVFPKPKKRLITTFTKNEVQAILDEALKRDVKYYCALKILLLTGQRPCDILRLKFKDIDMHNNFIYVRISKTAKEIHFPLYEKLREFVQSELLENFEFNQDELIFKDFNVEILGRRFRRIKKYLKITRPYLDLKTFRKTFATSVATLGMDRSRVADLLGHDDDRTTKKYYADVHTNSLRIQLNEIFSKN